MDCIFKTILIISLFLPASLSYSEDTPKPTTKITPCLYSGEWCKSENTQHKTAILLPEKITYLKPFVVQVRIPTKDNIQQMQLQFSMRGMQMIGNRFKLTRLKENSNNDIWQAEVVIPRCMSGRKDWLVELGVKTKDTIESSNFMVTVW